MSFHGFVKRICNLIAILLLVGGLIFFCSCKPKPKLNSVSKFEVLTFFNSRPVPPNAYRILFIGDSLTCHGPQDKVWDLFNGMAATTYGNDFVHLFATKAQEHLSRPVEIFLVAAGPLADLLEQIKSQPRLSPDLIVYQGGENDNFDDAFKNKYHNLLSSFTNTPAKAIVLGDWWNRDKSNFDRATAKEFGFSFIELVSIQERSDTKGDGRPYGYPGVAAHPNDIGMKAIADALSDKFQTEILPAK
jgi:hypothetical protein